MRGAWPARRRPGRTGRSAVRRRRRGRAGARGIYLIHRVYVGGPSLPLDEQVRIVWRIPEPELTPTQETLHGEVPANP
ncbi:hypothetical protein F9278_25835 [Streptomyces phaeolivaceus]|uniref:Uncharacterized protein n=1 Tax=Streptomyces phaeolivaceus TaxID=2653200 RepID=A0A5P8K6Q2_9ACTN|nr:hypothetical protein F9278_25835 [Streptomyces phaeolivaceus]